MWTQDRRGHREEVGTIDKVLTLGSERASRSPAPRWSQCPARSATWRGGALAECHGSQRRPRVENVLGSLIKTQLPRQPRLGGLRAAIHTAATGGLNTGCFLSVLEGWSLRSRCVQGWFLPRPLPAVCRWPPPLCPHVDSALCVRITAVSTSREDTS